MLSKTLQMDLIASGLGILSGISLSRSYDDSQTFNRLSQLEISETMQQTGDASEYLSAVLDAYTLSSKDIDIECGSRQLEITTKDDLTLRLYGYPDQKKFCFANGMKFYQPWHSTSEQVFTSCMLLTIPINLSDVASNLYVKECGYPSDAPLRAHEILFNPDQWQPGLGNARSVGWYCALLGISLLMLTGKSKSSTDNKNPSQNNK